MYSVVLDTNVIVAALRSRRGASFAILHRIGIQWEPLIRWGLNVPGILEGRLLVGQVGNLRRIVNPPAAR